jgi:dihydrofolate reductase
MSNIVYIGTSLDGFIADRNGGLDWLQSVPNPENDDFGWGKFMKRIDAIVMGRKTFETVAGFSTDWPYEKKVFVLSNTIKSLPNEFEGKAEIMNGTPTEITSKLDALGYKDLYIDGGNTIQRFLADDLIDELIITRLPILLGGGTLLFGNLPRHLIFDLVETDVLLDAMVVSHYRRKS